MAGLGQASARFNKPYDQLTYQPMQEVLSCLRANAFNTFIVSGGGADFMRVWAERVYGIPPEQVVGSTGQAKFELRDGKPVLVKSLDYLSVDDAVGKPVGILQFIGRRPIASFGNSVGNPVLGEVRTAMTKVDEFHYPGKPDKLPELQPLTSLPKFDPKNARGKLQIATSTASLPNEKPSTYMNLA